MVGCSNIFEATQLFLFSRDAEHLVVAVDAVLPGLAAGQGGDGQRVLGVPGVGAHRGPGRGGPVAGHRAPGNRALMPCFPELNVLNYITKVACCLT